MVNSAHWTKIFLTTHLGTGSIFVFTEKILWIISLILKISSLLPPGSFGGPDADLKLDIMKLNSHIILIKCIISVFSDTLKIYDKKSIFSRLAKNNNTKSKISLSTCSYSYLWETTLPGLIFLSGIVTFFGFDPGGKPIFSLEQCAWFTHLCIQIYEHLCI